MRFISYFADLLFIVMGATFLSKVIMHKQFKKDVDVDETLQEVVLRLIYHEDMKSIRMIIKCMSRDGVIQFRAHLQDHVDKFKEGSKIMYYHQIIEYIDGVL
jgi:hypothetical protein